MLYEIKKLLSKKIIFLWGLFLITVSLLYPLYFTYNYNKFNSENYKDIEKAYKQVWDKYKYNKNFLLIRHKSHEETERTNNIHYFTTPLSAYEAYLAKESARNTGKSIGIHFDSNMQNHSIQGLKEQLLKIQNTNSYQYQNIMKEKNMMERCKLEYVNVYLWNKFDIFETLIVFAVFVFILFILTGVYIKERSSNMNYILCTSQIGAYKIIINKWLAGCLIGVGSIILVNINLTISFILYGNSSGYDVNIVNLGYGLVYTPYNIDIWEYMLLKVLFQCIGIIFLVTFAEFISLLSQYRYIVILFGGLLFLPQTVLYFVFYRNWYIDFLFDYSLLPSFYTEHAFYKYHSFNIFGNPINYNTLYIITLIILTIFIGILTIKKYHRYISLFNRC